MSALVIELATSRRIAYNGGSPIGTREFTVTGCADEAAVYALFKLDGEPPTNLPNKFSAYPSLSGLVPSIRLVALDFDLRKDESVLDKWLVSITYREVTLSGTGSLNTPITTQENISILKPEHTRLPNPSIQRPSSILSSKPWANTSNKMFRPEEESTIRTLEPLLLK
jgi:hypothetical protein